MLTLVDAIRFITHAIKSLIRHGSVGRELCLFRF